MDNQHRKIKGYRELTQAEIDLMNEIKTKGVELGELVARVGNHLARQRIDSETDDGTEEGRASAADERIRIANAEPGRWASIGRTHLQEGLMALTRAVAQPTFF